MTYKRSGESNEFQGCIAKNSSEVGKTDVIETQIKETANRKPIVSKPYKLSTTEREQIKEIVQEWKEAGIVQETVSPYATPVPLIKKETG